MRQRALLLPVAFGVTAFAFACAGSKRQAQQVEQKPATSTGSKTDTSTNTGIGYAGNKGSNGDAGAQLPPATVPPASNTPPDQPDEPINSAGAGTGFPDPTAPANPPSPPANTPPNNWTGEKDEIPATASWAITSLDPGTKVASDGTVTTPGATSGTVPPSNVGAGAGADAVTYDGKVAQILNANCVNGCHVAGGQRPNSPMDTFNDSKQRGADIVGRANGGGMPPAGPMNQGDIDALKAWQAGGFLQSAAAGAGAAAGATGDAGNGGSPVLEITDQRYGNYLNQTKVTGKVGQTLKIVNKRANSSFTIHTNGAPFPHGNEIAPGSTQEYRLEAPYQGEGDIYEHTDGSQNTDRLIKLEVTQ